MRMKWRLFSVSLKVSMAIPPMPEFSSADVSIELNVSVHRKHTHIFIKQFLLGIICSKQRPQTLATIIIFKAINTNPLLSKHWVYCAQKCRNMSNTTKMTMRMLKYFTCTLTSKQRPVFDDLSLHFFSSACWCGHSDAHLLRLQLSQDRLCHVLPNSTDLHTHAHTWQVHCCWSKEIKSSEPQNNVLTPVQTMLPNSNRQHIC